MFSPFTRLNPTITQSVPNTHNRKIYALLKSENKVISITKFPFLIGRISSTESKNDWIINNKSISKEHAIINMDFTLNEIFLIDLNSINGTYVNEIKIKNKKIMINTNDTLKFGNDPVTYIFEKWEPVTKDTECTWLYPDWSTNIYQRINWVNNQRVSSRINHLDDNDEEIKSINNPSNMNSTGGNNRGDNVGNFGSSNYTNYINNIDNITSSTLIRQPNEQVFDNEDDDIKREGDLIKENTDWKTELNSLSKSLNEMNMKYKTWEEQYNRIKRELDEKCKDMNMLSKIKEEIFLNEEITAEAVIKVSESCKKNFELSSFIATIQTEYNAEINNFNYILQKYDQRLIEILEKEISPWFNNYDNKSTNNNNNNKKWFNTSDDSAHFLREINKKDIASMFLVKQIQEWWKEKEEQIFTINKLKCDWIQIRTKNEIYKRDYTDNKNNAIKRLNYKIETLDKEISKLTKENEEMKKEVTESKEMRYDNAHFNECFVNTLKKMKEKDEEIKRWNIKIKNYQEKYFIDADGSKGNGIINSNRNNGVIPYYQSNGNSFGIGNNSNYNTNRLDTQEDNNHNNMNLNRDVSTWNFKNSTKKFEEWMKLREEIAGNKEWK